MRILALPLLLGLAACLGSGSEAQARLGQPVESFKAKLRGSYKLKTVNKKQDRSYFIFTLLTDENTRQTAPGFAAGITATVVDGKVVGQSMVLRFGDNFASGKDMATWHCMDFAYEALGKPGPQTETAAKQEFDQFSAAIDQVLSGTAQHVRYPGFKYLITMSRTESGDVLIAVTPEFGSQANKANPPGKPGAGPQIAPAAPRSPGR